MKSEIYEKVRRYRAQGNLTRSIIESFEFIHLHDLPKSDDLRSEWDSDNSKTIRTLLRIFPQNKVRAHLIDNGIPIYYVNYICPEDVLKNYDNNRYWDIGTTWAVLFEEENKEAFIGRIQINKGSNDNDMDNEINRIGGRARNIIKKLVLGNLASYYEMPITAKIHRLSGEEVRLEQIDGESLDLPVFLALLSLYIKYPIPKTYVSTGKIDETGKINKVKYIVEKYEAAVREIPGLECFLYPADGPVVPQVKKIKLIPCPTADFIDEIFSSRLINFRKKNLPIQSEREGKSLDDIFFEDNLNEGEIIATLRGSFEALDKFHGKGEVVGEIFKHSIIRTLSFNGTPEYSFRLPFIPYVYGGDNSDEVGVNTDIILRKSEDIFNMARVFQDAFNNYSSIFTPNVRELWDVAISSCFLEDHTLRPSAREVVNRIDRERRFREKRFHKNQWKFLSFCPSDEYCSENSTGRKKIRVTARKVEEIHCYNPPPEFLGQKYEDGKIVFIGARPGSPSPYEPPEDQKLKMEFDKKYFGENNKEYNEKLMKLTDVFAHSGRFEDALNMNDYLNEYMPSWKSSNIYKWEEWWPKGKLRDYIAFINLVKCRRVNQEDDSIYVKCIQNYTAEQIKLLEPKLIIYTFKKDMETLEKNNIDPRFCAEMEPEYIVYKFNDLPFPDDNKRIRNAIKKILER